MLLIVPDAFGAFNYLFNIYSICDQFVYEVQQEVVKFIQKYSNLAITMLESMFLRWVCCPVLAVQELQKHVHLINVQSLIRFWSECKLDLVCNQSQ